MVLFSLLLGPIRIMIGRFERRTFQYQCPKHLLALDTAFHAAKEARTFVCRSTVRGAADTLVPRRPSLPSTPATRLVGPCADDPA